MREAQKLITGFLILAIIVSCLQYTATDATAASNTTRPAGGTEKPAVNMTGCVTGTVFDAAGNLVPDADVYLHDGRGVAMGLTVTDGNGTYTYTELEPGNYSIVVQVDGYAWFKKFVVTTGAGNMTNVYIPDYVHWPVVTPWVAPAPVNNSKPAGSEKIVTATPVPGPAQTNVTRNHTAPDYNDTIIANESAEESGGSPIDDFVNGVVGFFKSIFGM